jgi:[acyl-carrier-protein] S-malonyltransferase
VAAGTISFGDAVRTVRNRGQYMQEAVPVGQGAMAAVLGMDLEPLQQVCAETAHGEVVQPANINSPGQIVISGSAGAVGRAAELAKQRGAKRALMLPVSAPFHCALMQPAQDRLADDLAKLALGDMRLPLITNVDAAFIQSPEQARDTLSRQVTGTVQWEPSMRALIARGVNTFVEVGPGKVLCGLMRQIDRAQTCLSVEDDDSLQKVVNHFTGQKPTPHSS